MKYKVKKKKVKRNYKDTIIKELRKKKHIYVHKCMMMDELQGKNL